MENLPRSKMGKKWPKNTEKMGNWPDFPFFLYFSAIFPPFSIGANFPRFSHFFPSFVFRPVFHCVAGPHDCNSSEKSFRKFLPSGFLPLSRFQYMSRTPRPGRSQRRHWTSRPSGASPALSLLMLNESCHTGGAGQENRGK